MVSARRICPIAAVVAGFIYDTFAFANPGAGPKLSTTAPSRLQVLPPFPRTLKKGALPFRGGEARLLTTALQQSQSSAFSNKPAVSYYLVFSPGFAKKFALTTAGLLLFRINGIDSIVEKLFLETYILFPAMLQGLFSFGSNFILPLLSSSCCLVQLLINIAVGSSGCAGFNSLLGPLRPYFLSLFVYLNAISKPQAVQALLRYSIALMPEFVHVWKSLTSSQWRRNHSSLGHKNGSISATVQVKIPTMGCVACINKIESSLRKCAPANVVDATSWLDPNSKKGGSAKVKLSADSEEDLGALTTLVVQTIEGAGFGGCSIATVEVEGSKPQ